MDLHDTESALPSTWLSELLFALHQTLYVTVSMLLQSWVHYAPEQVQVATSIRRVHPLPCFSTLTSDLGLVQGFNSLGSSNELACCPPYDAVPHAIVGWSSAV